MNQSVIGALCAIAVAGSAFAQAPKKPAGQSLPRRRQPVAEVKDAATLEFEKFRAEMEDSNPAELFEMKGEEQWKTKRGPKNVSLAESCDLGQGVGKVEGAYVKMPRYFADANAVMDAERRIVWCMVEKQGFKFDDIAKRPFANDNFTPDITNLVTYVAGHSRKMKIDVPLTDPKVREAWEIGKEIAAYRAGPYDFSCNTCHGSDGKRIRMQNLPNISTPRRHERRAGLAGLPHDRRRNAHPPVAHGRLLPPAALPAAEICLRCGHLFADLHDRQRQRPGLQRPGHQALRGRQT
jgi:sulfur-oxidizing protein SoxA